MDGIFHAESSISSINANTIGQWVPETAGAVVRGVASVRRHHGPRSASCWDAVDRLTPRSPAVNHAPIRIHDHLGHGAEPAGCGQGHDGAVVQVYIAERLCVRITEINPLIGPVEVAFVIGEVYGEIGSRHQLDPVVDVLRRRTKWGREKGEEHEEALHGVSF